jgi:hypothetical protein
MARKGQEEGKAQEPGDECLELLIIALGAGGDLANEFVRKREVAVAGGWPTHRRVVLV